MAKDRQVTNIASGNARVGAQVGNLNIADGNARVGFQVGSQRPPKKKAEEKK